jgi:hypothetical protein
MSKFVSIYLAAVKKKSLRDEIVVQEIVKPLPSVVREAAQEYQANLSTIEQLRKRDSEVARNRLEKIRSQISKRSGLDGVGK